MPAIFGSEIWFCPYTIGNTREIEMAALVKKNPWIVPAVGFTVLILAGIVLS